MNADTFRNFLVNHLNMLRVAEQQVEMMLRAINAPIPSREEMQPGMTISPLPTPTPAEAPKPMVVGGGTKLCPKCGQLTPSCTCPKPAANPPQAAVTTPPGDLPPAEVIRTMAAQRGFDVTDLIPPGKKPTKEQKRQAYQRVLDYDAAQPQGDEVGD